MSHKKLLKTSAQYFNINQSQSLDTGNISHLPTFSLTCDRDNNVLRGTLSISRLRRGALDLGGHVLRLSRLSLRCGRSLSSGCGLLSDNGRGWIRRGRLARWRDDGRRDHRGLNFG